MDYLITKAAWLLIDLIELAAIIAGTFSIVLGLYLILTP